MPRNDIAAIIGLIVAFWYVFAGPGRPQGLRSPRAIGMAVAVFVIAFAITWIVLRLFNY
jgi:hypothetical protein